MSQRLDLVLAARGLASSRTAAQRLVAQGQVRVNGRVAVRASQPVQPGDLIEAEPQRWVSRAADKLLGALRHFEQAAAAIQGARVLDAGASTGGFTQVCLAHGAAEVLAVDVGHGQLHPEIAADPRVRSMPGRNLRDLDLAMVGGPVQVIVCDVSFISVRLLLDRFAEVLAAGGTCLVMVKPQFEVGRERLGRGGVVSDPALQHEVVEQVRTAGQRLGWTASEPVPSPITGEHGNQEWFICFQAPG